MTNIAYTINYMEKGGPSNVVRSLLDKIDKNIYSVYLITLFSKENVQPVIDEIEAAGITVIKLDYPSRMECMLNGNALFDKVIEENNIEIIHSHGFIPDILSARCKCKVKTITTIHNNMYEDYLQTYGSVKSKLFILVHQHYLNKLDEQVCCSRSVYDVMNSHLSHASYVRNGIGSTIVAQPIDRADYGIKQDDLVYVFAGNLNKGKNIVWLMTQFKQYHNSNEHLLVLGDGEFRDECQNLCDDNMHVIGFTTNAIAYFKISDVYISASLSEGFSISVLEALDNGLHLFLSDIPSHKEIVSITDSVYVGQCFSDAEFEKCLIDLRSNINKSTKEEVISFKNKYLSSENMMKSYQQLY